MQNNLAIARYPLDGPARSLEVFEDGIAFCEQRGLVESARQLEANNPGLLVELGRPDEALARAGRLAAELEATGDTHDLLELRAVELASRVDRGDLGERTAADWLIEMGRQIGAADTSVFALAAAAMRLAEEAPDETRALLAEVEQIEGSRGTPYYARQLAAMARTALATGDEALARRLADGLEPSYPLNEHALCAVRAQLAEHAADHEGAAALYDEAAARWQKFGNVPERAYALLGQGRCLLALSRPEAEQPLHEAGDLFAAMGYRPALVETKALLEQVAAAPAP
jgi:tetratricopeptide (TPR) repeat protein